MVRQLHIEGERERKREKEGLRDRYVYTFNKGFIYYASYTNPKPLYEARALVIDMCAGLLFLRGKNTTTTAKRFSVCYTICTLAQPKYDRSHATVNACKKLI